MPRRPPPLQAPKPRKAWSTSSDRSAQARGYGAEHRRIRAHLLATVVLCEACTRQGRTTVGTIADHIKPLADGGTGRRDNYQLLCKPCHHTKSLADRGARPCTAIDRDGWPIG